MGIRFACHVCSKKLNIKQELAGRRGICPACSAKFRIPLEDAETSTPIEDAVSRDAVESRPTNGQPVATSNGSSQVGSTAVAASVGADQLSTLSSIDLIDGDPTSTWYVRPPSGGQYGPATGEILRQWIAEGRVASSSLLWREGWPQWREASEALPELVERLPDPTGSERPTVPRVNASPSATPTPSATPSPSASEFGFGDPVQSGNINSTPANTKTASLAGRSESGAERRSRSNKRTTYIVYLIVLAVVLIFALAYVLSK